MKILVNGGSVSRGPGSWPYYIQEALEADMVNLSQAGAGCNYISESTIAELAQRSYDLVLIQWPPFVRFDFKVAKPTLFSGTPFTSEHQSRQNDWPEKIIHPVNDQDYVEKDWIFGCGIIANKDSDPALNEAFQGYYKYTGPAEQLYHSTMQIIALQSFLKVNQIPYVYCFSRPWIMLDRYRHITDLIDMKPFFTELYLSEIARQFGYIAEDGFHPDARAYKLYAKRLLPKIQETLNAKS